MEIDVTRVSVLLCQQKDVVRGGDEFRSEHPHNIYYCTALLSYMRKVWES